MSLLKNKMVTGLALSLVLATSANANLIVNGGFEKEAVSDGQWRYFLSSAVDGWEGDNIEIWQNLNGVGAYEGEQHAELNAHPYDGTAFSIFQDFETTANQAYSVSFAYRARRSAEEAFQFDVSSGNSSLLSELITDHTTNQWSIYNANFIGTGETTRLMFTSVTPETGTLGNFLDAVSVNVPEPGSIALLGLGLVGLGITRKNSK